MQPGRASAIFSSRVDCGRSGRFLLWMLLALVATGCSVTPKPLTSEDISRRVADDRRRMYADQEPIRGPISLPEVAARAIKYNLDYRVKVLEQALVQGALAVTTWDMFPRLLANAGYIHRNNELGYINADGIPSTTAIERTRRIASAEFSWNLLDFGVSYYRAKVAADGVLVAEERKRKVVQNLMQDVRIAYWRALGAQRLIGQIDSLMQRSKTALARARSIEQQGLLPQVQVLAYQRALLDSTVLLQSRRQELELAKADLGQLMNLPPNTNFTLVDTADPQLPPMPTNIDRLEDMALSMRPELREEDYRRRISATDARRALVSALPGISLDFGAQYDSNSFLLNNQWIDSGLRVSMNLFKLASIPTINRQRDAQLAVDDTRRMAQAMAVLTQVRVAAQRYALSREELDQVSESASVDVRLANYARAAATSRVDSELELIRTEARAVLSGYQKHVAYANAQAAFGRLYNSIGLDVIPPAEGADLRSIALAVERTLSDWHRTTFERPQLSGQALPAVAVRVDGLEDPSRRAVVAQGVTTALQRHGIETSEASDGWRLVVRVVGAGGRGERDVDRRMAARTQQQRTHWTVTLLRPDGSRAGTTNYASIMAGGPTPESLASIAQSAVENSAVALNDWLSSRTSNLARNEHNARSF